MTPIFVVNKNSRIFTSTLLTKDYYKFSNSYFLMRLSTQILNPTELIHSFSNSFYNLSNTKKLNTK